MDARMTRFRMSSEMEPAGDQPAAIDAVSGWLADGARYATLLGVTGSGKTFTMAKVVERLQRPTLVLAPNKTLAAQLYAEFKAFFPDNAVEYFVSYYDYYQPEAYVPNTDTYIEKDATINDAIDRMRNSATRSLMERRDVLIVASISCIYGLGSPENYRELSVHVRKGAVLDRDSLLRGLASIQYRRDNSTSSPGGSVSAATWSRCSPSTRSSTRSASSCGARRSNRSTSSIRCAGTSCASSMR